MGGLVMADKSKHSRDVKEVTVGFSKSHLFNDVKVNNKDNSINNDSNKVLKQELLERHRGFKIYTKDKYDILLQDFSKIMKTYVEYKFEEDSYIDLRVLKNESIISIEHPGCSNSMFSQYAINMGFKYREVDCLDYNEYSCLTVSCRDYSNKFNMFDKYVEDIKTQYKCIDCITVNDVLDLADHTSLKLLIVLKSRVGMKDLVKIRNFGCRYGFIADTKVKGD